MYIDTVRVLHDALIAEEQAWIECGEDVEFAVYVHENGSRDIYVLAVDWYSAPDHARSFTLRLGNERYDLQFPFGRMLKIAVCGKCAVFANVEDAEIVFTAPSTVRVSGVGNGIVVTAADGGKLTEYPLDFTVNSCVDIVLK